MPSSPVTSMSSPGAGPSTSNNMDPLTRTDSRSSFTSIHARMSLRRMMTHETGAGVEKQEDGRLDTHDEHHDEHTPPSSPHAHHRENDIGIQSGSSSTSTKNDNLDHSESDDQDHDHDDIDEKRKGSKGQEGGDLEEGGISKKKKKKEVELQDQTNLLPVKQVIMVFIGLSMALFCSLLDQTVVTTALPTLGQVFNRADIVSWVGTGYLLTSTAFQPIYSRISDIFGRKPTLLLAMTIFLLGALGCSVSASMIQLIVFRSIQGIGGGGILTLSMIIVSDIVTLKERGKYQGILGCVIATANSCGPLIGGAFTEKVTWRWCFYLSLPLTSIAIIVIVFLLPLRKVDGSPWKKLRQVDWIGSFLTLLWTILFLIGLSWAGSTYSWSSPAVLVPLILGLAFLGFFIFLELKPRRFIQLPLIPLYIFKDSTVWAAMLSTFFSGIAFYCTLYYLPTYFQIVHQSSAIESGILILPLCLVQTSTAFISGYIVSKTGDYFWNLTLGFFIWTIGLGLMTTVSDLNISQGKLIGYQILVGIGAGQTFQTSLIAIQAAVTRKDMATATGTRNFLRMLGGTIGLAACSSILNNVVRNYLADLGIDEIAQGKVLKDPTGKLGGSGVDETLIRQAYAMGISHTFILMVPLTALSFILIVFFVKRIPLKRADDQAKKEEAKAWIEKQKEAKHKNKSGHSSPVDQSNVDLEKTAGVETPSTSQHINSSTVPVKNGSNGKSETFSERVKDEIRRDEDGLEEAGRGLGEAFGAVPSKREGKEQGPVGSER